MLRYYYSVNFCAILITLLLVNWVRVIVAGRCISQAHEEHPKYIYYKGQKINLTLATTSRLTHRFATHAFKIILENVLGYRGVEVLNIEDDNDFATAIPNDDEDSIDPPRWLINLEVWTPTNESSTVHLLEQHDLKDCGSISQPGRFGWFISRKKYKNGKKLDIHWSVFENPTLASRFGFSKSVVQQYVESKVDGSTHCSGCDIDPEFKNGTYIPEWCHKNQSCAVLLAPFYNSTYFVIKHIKMLKLYVKVYWLGNNLQKVIDKLDEPVMILMWTPSIIIPSEENFISVSFPSCSALQMKNIHDCKYDTTRLTKISWINLKTIAKSIYNYLHWFEFDKSDYELFFDNYKNNISIEQSACAWVKRSLEMYKVPTEQIYIGGIFPLTGNASLTTTAYGILLAAKMAKDDINENKILRNYDLQLIPHNGQCESNHVMKAFINMVRYNDRLLGILGPGCSETVEPLAGVSKLYNTPIISYSAEGVSFADRTKYPFFFRTIGDNQQFIPVYRNFFKKMKWKSISALTEDGQKYTEYLSHMSQQDLLLENKKFPREREPNDMKKYLEELKNKRARIIIVDVPDQVARSVMCEAYNLNMTAKHGYVWFLPEWFSYDWYNTTYYNKKKNESVPCSIDKMLESVNGYFSLSHAFFASNDSIMTIGNKTVGEWRKTYEAKCHNDPKCVPSNYAGYTYDAMWTYAFAFKKLLKVIPDAIYTLHSKNTTRKFVDFIQNTDFSGVSGHIAFEKSASRHSVIHIKQWVNQTKNLVGIFYPNTTTKGLLQLNESALVWLSGSLPTDGTEPPHKCIVEGFAIFLDVECDKAILIMNVIGISTLIPILAVIIFFIKRKYEQKVLEHQKLMNMKFGFDLVKLNTLDKWEIPRENVVLNRKLGQGAFGTVYGGEAYFDDKGWVGVAVKTLKTGSTTEERLDFLSEAEVMKRFDHKNIVKLLGVCTQNEPVYTVMEFMLYGDLKTFLLARRHLINDRSFEENDEISSKKLTNMALDVARALSYLAEMKFVHRDIACRNCLLNAQRMVKLGDFGMTRPVFENDYYKFNRRGMLPVRWMAPESLGLGVFTPSSDIWSYGVLLYEIITFGSFPFQGKTNTEVLEYVKAGNILKVPSGAKPQLEALIKSCWNYNPKQRPQASQIVEFLANSPRLLSPCLDVPLSSVELCNTGNDGDVPLPEAFRKCSVDRYPRSEVVSEIDNRHVLIRQQSISSALLSDESSVLSAESVHLENYVKEPLLGASTNAKYIQKVDENKLLKRQPSKDYKLLDSSESAFSIQNDSIL